jgi:gamma-glutamyl:cysteine ligase YbdK (ATP-grasp superfamily)
MYADIAPHDPAGVLQDEFLNARGAIARFSRNSIEIRVLDVQECPQADVAIAAAVVAALKLLVAERWTDVAAQQSVEVEPLERVLLATIRDAERAVIDDAGLLRQFGVTREAGISLGELWHHLRQEAATASPHLAVAPLAPTLTHGPLARRISSRLGANPAPGDLRCTYRELTDDLAGGCPLEP